jgi:hypothetical protein
MAMRARISWATLAAILVAAVSVAVTRHLIDYPLGAAWDRQVDQEQRVVVAVASGADAAKLDELAARWDHRGILAAIVLALAAVPALSMSVQINAPDVDPRGVVPSIVAASGARVIFDRYSDYEQDRRILGIRQRPIKDMADIVVTSNLAYDRFALDAAPSGMAAYYRGLSAKPHLDVSNGRPTVGYSTRRSVSSPWTARSIG